MNLEQESALIAEIRDYVTNNLPLSSISNKELEEKIEEIVSERLGSVYCPIQKRVSIVNQIYGSIRGFGLLDELLSDDAVTEVMINGPEHIFIERGGRLYKSDRKFESQKRLEDVIQRIVGLAGREVNQANPICDTRLPDGSRVNVVLPPVALCGPTLTIRKFSKTPMTMEKLIGYGSLTPDIAEKLAILVKAKYNIFISGGTGSGKTTFLNALSNYIPKDERVITIEDSAELQIVGIENLVRLETRNANTSGSGQITIRDLIKSSRAHCRRRSARRRSTRYAASHEHRSRRFALDRPRQFHRRYAQPFGNHGAARLSRTSARRHSQPDCLSRGYHHPSVASAR